MYVLHTHTYITMRVYRISSMVNANHIIVCRIAHSSAFAHVLSLLPYPRSPIQAYAHIFIYQYYWLLAHI